MEWLVSKGVKMTTPFFNQSSPVLTWQWKHPEQLPSRKREKLLFTVQNGTNIFLIKSA
jgi:hypothetical protein